MKKQSSVEIFAKKLAEQGLLVYKDYENLVAYQEAKAMHKEECKESYYESLLSNFQTFDQYYNETFLTP